MEIPDEDVPLVENPFDNEEVEIPDMDVPLAAVPKTGDNSLLWRLTALLSTGGLLGFGLGKKKKRPAAEGTPETPAMWADNDEITK